MVVLAALPRAALAALLLLPIVTVAADPPGPAWHLDTGGGDGVRRLSAGLSWPGWTDIPCERGCRADQWWLLRAARWWHPHDPGSHHALWDLSAMPVLRIGNHASGATRGFLEVGVGVHVLSDSRIGPARGFGSSLQFGETLAAGLEFGEHHQQALTARLEHVSNGGLKSPNNGITFFVLEYRHDFH